MIWTICALSVALVMVLMAWVWCMTSVVLTEPAEPSRSLVESNERHGPSAHGPHQKPEICPDCEDNRELMLKDPPMYGDDVRELQTRLKELGLYKGPINATFDALTCEALKAFQRSKGLPASGVMTHDLWYALGPAPKVPEPAPQPPARPQGVVSIVIDTRKLKLTIMDDGKPFKTYPCAIGKPSTPTPVGEFMIMNKWMDPGGPFGSRWMGLNIPWGTYGIHGTNRPYSIGSMASAGCIRMFNHHVAEIYPWVPIGTHVYIIGHQPVVSVTRSMKQGDTGIDVQYLQYKVRQAGFNPGMIDGRFGRELEEALLEIQRFYGLPVTGTAGPNEFHVLGIK